MGQVIDFWTAREYRPAPAQDTKCRCGICGADLWHISKSGEVCCADCDTVCPYRFQEGSAGKGGQDRRQAVCTLADAGKTGDID
jgi:hypothetical protein